MIYCTNCGSENYDDSRFCSRCGFAIQNESLPPKQVVFVSKEESMDQPVSFDPPTPPQTAQNAPMYVIREQRNTHSNKWIGVSLICAGIFLMIVIILPFFFLAFASDYNAFGEFGGKFGEIGGAFGSIGSNIGEFFGELGSRIGEFFGGIGDNIGDTFDGIGDDFDIDVRHHDYGYSSNGKWIIIGLLSRLFFVAFLVVIAIVIIKKTRSRGVSTN
jgi:hypothetical protein